MNGKKYLTYIRDFVIEKNEELMIMIKDEMMSKRESV